MAIDYNGRTFRTVRNTANGEASGGTIFRYEQEGAVVRATYAGGGIVTGHLVALVDERGNLDTCGTIMSTSGLSS